MRRIVFWAVILFLAYIAIDPTGAAAMWDKFLSALHSAGDSLRQFSANV